MNESEPCCTGAAETQGLFRSLAVPACLRATECCLWWSHSPHSDRSWWLQGVTLPDLASPGPCGAHQVQGTRTELLGGAGSTLRAEEQASVKWEVAFSDVRRLARRTNGARVFQIRPTAVQFPWVSDRLSGQSWGSCLHILC